MAHPAVHVAVTGGIAALYWFWSGKKAEREGKDLFWNIKSKGSRRWRQAITFFLIIFFGIFIDIDYIFPLIGPKIFAWGAYGVQENVPWGICSFEFIPDFAFRWLHSWQTLAGVAIISLFLKSQLPFWSFGLHMLLDGLLNGGVGLSALIHKPLILDVYMFLKSLGWL
jgi:hypothetical protein